MKPAPFSFHAPGALAEAVELLDSLGGDAKVLAGGQTLVPAMNMRMARPSALIDLNQIPELRFIRREEGALRIGAMTRQRTLERSAEVGRHAEILHLALPHIAHFQIRNRGTLGGSVAHNDPAAELPAIVALLDGVVTVASRAGERRLRWDEFFLGMLRTAAEPNEIVTSVSLPALPEQSGAGFAEVSRRHGDFALVGAAAVLHADERGAIDLARLVLFGVGAGPVRSGAAETCLVGETGGPALWREAADIATRGLDPFDDLHASAAYRREVAATLARRVLAQAGEKARAAVH